MEPHKNFHSNNSVSSNTSSRKARNKEVKRSTVEVGRIPELTSLPGTLDPLAFAKARTAEILLLKKEINDAQFRGARRVFQTLPRSMRRRAASYNIKRLPTRLRLKALQEAAKDPETVQKKIRKPPCRRRRRRPTNIRQEFGRRQENKKAWLETHLWHAKRAKMQDLWGYRIAVKSNEKCLKSCVKTSFNGCFLHDMSFYEIVTVDVDLMSFDGLILKSNDGSTVILDTDKSIMGLVIMLNANYMLVHPLMTEFVVERLKSIGLNPVVKRGSVNIFRVQGSQSTKILQNVTPQLEGTFTIPDPRFSFPPTTDVNLDVLSIDWEAFWTPSTLELRKSERELNDMRSLNTIPGTKLTPSPDDPRMPIMIHKCIEMGTLVIVPQGWGWILWRSLIHTRGVRFGGLLEANLVTHEHGRMVFPQDYVSSPAYTSYCMEQEGILLESWQRRPPAKRINYFKFNIDAPFRITNVNVKYYVRVELRSGGVPEFNARIIDKESSIIIGSITSGFYSQHMGIAIGFGFLTCMIDADTCTVQNLNGIPREAHFTIIQDN